MTQQEIVTINAELRDITKTKAMHSLRKKGNIPGIIYGKGHDNVNLTLSAKEFTKQYKSGNMNINMKQQNYRFVLQMTHFVVLLWVAEKCLKTWIILAMFYSSKIKLFLKVVYRIVLMELCNINEIPVSCTK